MAWPKGRPRAGIASPEARARMSEAQRRRAQDPVVRAEMVARLRAPEAVAKQRLAQLGPVYAVLTEAQRADWETLRRRCGRAYADAQFWTCLEQARAEGRAAR